MSNRKLYLDDQRTPVSTDWDVVINFEEFKEYILENGVPEEISFGDVGDIEVWKNIVGYEDVYEVSNFGNVRRIRKNKGTVLGLLNLNKHVSGLYVHLRDFGRDKQFKVHRLVLTAFLGEDYEKPVVNHIDGNRWNNHLSNLEWCTHSENIKHSHDFLERVYTAYGENHKNSKTVSKYHRNGDYICTYGGVNEAGRQEGVPFTNIAKCARGERNSAGGFIWKYENRKEDIKSLITHTPKTEKDYVERFFIPTYSEFDGMKCAHWFMKHISSCKEVREIPKLNVHSMNPIGTHNILIFLKTSIFFNFGVYSHPVTKKIISYVI